MMRQPASILASWLPAGRRVRAACLAGALGLLIHQLVNMGFSTTLWAAPPGGSAKRAPAPAANPALRADVARNYGRLPLAFEPNQGQADSQVKFLSRGRGYQIFLTADETVISLRKSAVGSPQSADGKSKLETGNGKLENGNSKFEIRNSDPAPSTQSPAPDVLRIKLVGATQTREFEGQDRLPGISNYFIGKDAAQWRANIPHYRRVVAHEVYPGVDLVYYGQGRQLEYDFVIAPGANPGTIRFALQTGNSKLETGNSKSEIRIAKSGKYNVGATPWVAQEGRASASALRLDANGDLIVALEGGEVRFHKPLVYQEGSRQPSANGHQLFPNPESKTPDAGSPNLQSAISHRQFIEGRYVLLAENHVGFEVGTYDRTRPLVIDPVLSYSTYLGGNDIDIAKGIAVGSDGTVFITGETDSADFPIEHALQPHIGSQLDFPDDLFVSKISRDGSTLIYSTFLGGEAREIAGGIAVDAFGAAYLTGTTLSIDYPTTQNGFDPSCGLDGRCDETNNRFFTDAVVTKLNPAGSAIAFSSFFTASLVTPSHEQGFAIAVDANGNAYVTGSTTIGDDAFVIGVDSTGGALLYLVLLGGSGNDQGFGIAAARDGTTTVTGFTNSTDFPVTGNALQAVFGGVADGFLARLTSAGGLPYITYLGGTGADQGNAVAQDTTGLAYVTGVTNSTAVTLPFAIPGAPVQADCALSALLNCDGDAFVAKLDPAQVGAASLIYFTYLGGSSAETGAGIAVDTANSAYVTGFTNSPDFPVIVGAFQPNYGGGNTDAFVSKLDAAATALVYSSYLGGSNAEEGRGIAVDVNANAYVAGQTCSTDFPVARPLQGTQAGNCDAFVAKVLVGADIALSASTLNFGTLAVGDTSPGQKATLTSIGESNLNFGAVTVSGDFAIQADTCSNQSLPPNAFCEITVTFSPSSLGPKTETLTIPDNVAPGTHTVTLSGSGTNVGVSLAPTELIFGDQGVGSTSAVQIVTLTNTGGDLTILGIDASGDFAQNNACGNLILAGGSCQIMVTFAPTAIGLRAGAITITDSDPTSPQTITLSGHGTAPVAAVAPLNLAFGNQGATGAAQVVTLTNNGNAPLAIANIAVTVTFSQSSTCGGTLVAGASCQISVSFNPVAPGATTGQLTITDDATGSPHTAALSGTGVIPVVSLNPGSLTFAGQIITNPVSSSDPQTIILSNTGNTTLNITSALVTGVDSADFALTNNCPPALPAAESCAMSVVFTPGAAGTRLALLLITDDAPASPQSIALSGVGLLAPVASLSVTSLTFPDTAQGATSASQPVTLTNIGSAELLISNIATSSANFSVSSACAAALAPGGSCPITVTFTPQTSGNLFGTLNSTDSATGSPHTVQLAGNGLAVPNVSLFPITLTFGDQAVNTTSGSQTVTLTNTGGAPLAITSVNIPPVANGGDFGISSSNCTGTFVPGTGCAISVVFTPSAPGARVATLDIVDDAPNSPQSVPLAGNGVLPAGIGFNPSSLSFPSASVGTASAPQTVTLTSTGGGTLNINTILITGANALDFSLNHNCGASLAPTLTCTLTVIFTPSAGGSRLANISVTDNAPGSPHSVPLFGAGSTAAGDFTLAATPGQATIFAGDSANSTVTLTPLNGFSALVNFSCTTTVSQGSCSVSPASITPDGTNPETTTLTLRTTARVMAPPAPMPEDLPPGPGPRWAPALAALMLAAMIATARRKRVVLVLATLMLVTVFWTACGGGGTTVGTPRGTPAGNYTVTVTATSGTTSRTVAVLVQVN